MGLEALSQGALHATFIDSSKEALQCIRKNIELLHLEKQTTVLFGDVFSLIKKLPKESFDILYADPPYSQASELLTLLEFLDTHPLVKKGGLVLLEEGTSSSFPPLKTLVHKETRRFGMSIVHQFFRI